jgi:hypothetical protein
MLSIRTALELSEHVLNRARNASLTAMQGSASGSNVRYYQM